MTVIDFRPVVRHTAWHGAAPQRSPLFWTVWSSLMVTTCISLVVVVGSMLARY